MVRERAGLFDARVLDIVKRVPRGRVTTYGAIARELGTSPRAVGQALRRNKKPIIIPCHRVIRSDGSVGGYAGRPYSRKKERLLREDGIRIENGKVVLKA